MKDERKGWAVSEMGAVELGDKRLNNRCVQLLETFSKRPNESIPGACKGWSETMAAYRFFDNGLVTHEKILEPHKEATIERIRREKVILLCQDTTEISFTGKEKIEGLGVLSEEYQQGFYLHPMLAITPERLCLGVVGSQIWTRKELGKRRKRKVQEITEKESYRWIKGYQVANEIARNTAETMVVTVGDRESDIYELFCEGTQEGNKAYWLVRANHNREIERGCDKTKEKLKEELLNMPVISEIEFRLPAGHNRKGRIIKQEIRVSRITFKPPVRKEKLGNVEAQVVYCREIKAPQGKNPIEWILLTNVAIDSESRALEVVQWYLCRWQIEAYFRVLKRGCLVEELQLENAERIKACVALYMIVAWRVTYITMSGRVYPDMSCEALFEEAEWKSAYVITKKKRPPDQPPTLREMVRMVGQLGGHLGRKSDGEPGAETIWKGIQRLKDIAFGWQSAQEAKT